MSKIESYPVMVFTRDKTVRVEGEFNSSGSPNGNIFELKNNKGYLDLVDEHVWIYSKEEPKNANQYPYFWIKNDRFVKSNPSQDVYRSFRLNKLVNLDTDEIIKNAINSDSKEIYNDILINDLNASSEIFHPVLYTQDDFLKKLTKNALNRLCISLSKYKYKMTQKYMISNMKSALLSQTKMSTLYFNAWMEMLGLKVTIIIESTDDAEDKLEEPLVYLSEKDAVFELSELDDNFKFPEIKKKESNE